jgi:hypothetical protein
MYCYIKNSELIATSDTLITQKTDTEDGMVYDEVLETKLT